LFKRSLLFFNPFNVDRPFLSKTHATFSVAASAAAVAKNSKSRALPVRILARARS